MKIKSRCKCGRLLSAIRAGKVAAEVADRTCRNCKARWRVVVRPGGNFAGGFAHFVSMVCTRDAEPAVASDVLAADIVRGEVSANEWTTEQSN